MKYLLLAGTVFIASCATFFHEFKEALLAPTYGTAKYDPDKPGRFASEYCNPDSLDPDAGQRTTIEEDNEIRKKKENWGANRTNCHNSFQEYKYFEPSTLENP